MKLVGHVKAIQVSRTIREIVGPLQVRAFQYNFAPRDPNAKLKRFKFPQFNEPYDPKPPPSDKIVQLAERRQIGPILTERLELRKLQPISTEEGRTVARASKVEEKKEKSAFDVKLKKFDSAVKIKVIKEVRAFTNLGLKEAKELVENVPVLLKQGITQEEANGIIEKIKAAGGLAVTGFFFLVNCF